MRAEQITNEMVQPIIDEIDFTDGSNAHDEIRRGLAAALSMPAIRAAVLAEIDREHAEMMAALPGWDDMSDLDKGAALLHMHKRINEGDDYAIENYPAKFIEDPRLTGLSAEDACAHVARLFPYEDDYEALWEEHGNEVTRLYDLALNHERSA